MTGCQAEPALMLWCECVGGCGRNECGPDRCLNAHGQPGVVSGKIVVLAAVPLAQEQADLRAVCQWCRAGYERKSQAEARRLKAAAVIPADLFGELF